MKTWIALCTTALLLASCTKRLNDPIRELGEPVQVEFGFTIDPAESAVEGGQLSKTYETDDITVTFSADASIDQDTKATMALSNVWAIQFDAYGSFVWAHNTPSLDAGAAFKPTLRAGKNQKIYVYVATASDATDYATSLAGKTLDQFKAQVASGANFVSSASMDVVPMFSGEVTADIFAGGGFLSQTGITLKRTVAQIKFTVALAGAASGYTLESIRLVNIPKQAYIAAPAGTPFPQAADANFEASDLITSALTSQKTWYMPDNLRGVISNTDQKTKIPATADQQYSTYVEVIAAGDNRRVTTKIYLGANMTNDFNVMRNKVYTVSCTINSFDDTDNRVDIEELATVSADANCHMVIPGGAVRFTANRQGNSTTTIAPASVALVWQDVPNLIEKVISYADGSAVVVTNSSAGSGNALVAAYDGANGTGNILWSWHIWVTDYKPLEYSGVTGEQNQRYTVPGGEVHTYGSNFMEARLTANVTDHVIMDRNLGATKAFYAAPTSTVSTADAAKAFGFYYQWGRKDPFPNWDGASATSPVDVPLYDAANAPVTTAAVDINTISSAADNTLAYATANPLACIFSTTAPRDWYTITTPGNHNDDLWGDDATKSKYDPCPAGWRTGKKSTWADFISDVHTGTIFQYYTNGVAQTGNGTPTFVKNGLNGRYYQATGAWYPASGNRDSSTGFPSPAAAGKDGYSWTYMVNDVNGSIMGFHDAYITSNGTHNRAVGLSIRCVRE